jgi:hypothetical protein
MASAGGFEFLAHYCGFPPRCKVATFVADRIILHSAAKSPQWAAHRLVIGLSWPAMLVGLVATMKVYWLALLVKGKRQPVEDQ